MTKFHGQSFGALNKVLSKDIYVDPNNKTWHRQVLVFAPQKTGVQTLNVVLTMVNPKTTKTYTFVVPYQFEAKQQNISLTYAKADDTTLKYLYLELCPLNAGSQSYPVDIIVENGSGIQKTLTFMDVRAVQARTSSMTIPEKTFK